MDAQQFWNWFWVAFVFILVVWALGFTYTMAWHRGWDACQNRHHPKKMIRFRKSYGGYIREEGDGDEIIRSR
jgi:hypothetical protein